MRTEDTAHQIDKSRWPSGPWTTEPDRVQWQHSGYACLIVRNRIGALCGYVGVDSAHSYFEKDCEQVDVQVHGGLTYANKCSGPICHVPEPGMPADVWWLGFDCCHYRDYAPSMSGMDLNDGSLEYGIAYRDITYVTAEVMRLAEQLRERAA